MPRQSALTKRISSLLVRDIEKHPDKLCQEILKLRPEYSGGTEGRQKALENRYHYIKRQRRHHPQNYLSLLR